MSVPAGAAHRQRVVVVSTFPVHPRAFGGQLRAFHLARELGRVADVSIVSLTEAGEASTTRELAAGVSEAVVAKSAAHAAFEAEVSTRAGTRVPDIVAAIATDRTPEYGAALATALRDASAVVLEHPFMLPSVERAGFEGPLFYDAQNAEARHKEATLPESAEKAALVRETRDLERRACRRAALVATTGSRDRDSLRSDHDVPESRFVVVPNGADAEGIAFVHGERRAAATRRWLAVMRATRGWNAWQGMALFVGSNHPPNVEPAESIHAYALALPRMAFVLAGGIGELYRGRAVPDNLLVAGWVGDGVKHGLLAAATVGLNPVVRGYGSNVKVPEFLAAGVPVVTTEFGARELPVRDGAHVLVREPDLFPDAISGVAGGTIPVGDMAVAARRVVDERLSWTAVAAPWCAGIVEHAMRRATPVHGT